MSFTIKQDGTHSRENHERELARAREQRRSRTPEDHCKQMKQRRAAYHRPFIGVDGEGGNTGRCDVHLDPVEREFALKWGVPLPSKCACLLFVEQPTRRKNDLRRCGTCNHPGRSHRHEYWLLRAGDLALETGRPLSSWDCLGFLSDLDPEPIHVGYFFSYDVSQILSGLPHAKLERLNNRHQRKRTAPGTYGYFPVDVATGPCSRCPCDTYRHDKGGFCLCEHPAAVHATHFDLDYLPGNFLKVRRANPDGPWITVSETGAFFQQSFLKTLEDWKIGTAAERRQVKIGKDERGNFRQPNEEMRAYNHLEVRKMAQLMETFRTACTNAKLPRPHAWEGPGKLAKALLAAHGIPKAKDLSFNLSRFDCERFIADVKKTFYGGRFEASAIGYVPDLIRGPDINSAYPHELRNLPCLLCGEWEYGKKPTSDFYFAYGQFRPIEPVTFYGFPFRNKHGGTSYPASGIGWYWSREIEASIHQRFTIRGKCWSYHKRCDHRPFDWIPALYEERRRLERGGDNRGKPLKLTMNSIFGTLCQRVGEAQYNNHVWGSLITMGTRVRLQEFIHSLPGCREGGRRCGDDVWYLATDGLLSSTLPRGKTEADYATKELGAWSIDAEHQTGIFIVQPGLYFGSAVDKEGQRKAPKTRGLPRNKALEHEADFREAFRKLVATGDYDTSAVEIPLQLCYGLRLVVHQRKIERLGQWETKTRAISFDPEPKRARETYPSAANLAIRRQSSRSDILLEDVEYLRTYPPDGDPTAISTPYRKDLGDSLDERTLDDPWGDLAGQPDHMPYFGDPQEYL